MPKLSIKRLYQFKLLGAFVFSIPVVILIFLLVRILNAGSSKEIANNEAINTRNSLFSKGNRFGFTDKERTTTKPKGIFRIAVLGDSFIWGDGMPYEKVWSHKLEKSLLENYDLIEVMSWGKCGWSTFDECNFYKQFGKEYNIDLLIIDWVDNDLETRGEQAVAPLVAEKEFPRLYKIFPPIANVLTNMRSQRQYKSWLRDRYSEGNLRDYQKLLNDFHNLLAQNHINCLYVMTPGSSLDHHTKKHFEIVEPMIKKANFSCLNLYPIIEKKLGHYSDVELMANPVNTHPGEIMTEEFEAEVENYLEQNNYMNNVSKKKR